MGNPHTQKKRTTKMSFCFLLGVSGVYGGQVAGIDEPSCVCTCKLDSGIHLPREMKINWIDYQPINDTVIDDAGTRLTV